MSPAQTEPVNREQVVLVSALPGVTRIALGASLRLAESIARGYLRAGTRVIRATGADRVLQPIADEALSYLRELLAPDDGVARSAGNEPILEADVVEDERPTRWELRERGADLLRRSADVDAFVDEAHPAYVRILDELAPDEARILRLLALEGPQPAVDVRTGGPIGRVRDELIAPGLNMIAMEGGLRRSDDVARHLHNLYRLGLIWFSREQLVDRARYEVLEAQPEVAAAVKRAGRGRTVRRSIHLTPFGDDFCRMCLPLDDAGRRPGTG